MNIRIVDKKRFITFIISFVFLISSMLYGIYFVITKLKQKESNEIESKKEISVNRVETIKEDESIQNIINDDNTEIKKEEKTEIATIEYENTSYKYALTFPEKWFMNNDDSGSNFEMIEIEDGKKLIAGGQTFWSNYQNINEYDPQNKPDDFRLLSLTIYQDAAKNSDEFAKKLGFEKDLSKEEFQTQNVKGVQLVAPGLLSENPRIIVLFQNEDKFFVFRPAFLNGDVNATDAMEAIVKSFRFTE